MFYVIASIIVILIAFKFFKGANNIKKTTDVAIKFKNFLNKNQPYEIAKIMTDSSLLTFLEKDNVFNNGIEDVQMECKYMDNRPFPFYLTSINPNVLLRLIKYYSGYTFVEYYDEKEWIITMPYIQNGDTILISFKLLTEYNGLLHRQSFEQIISNFPNKI